MRAQILLVAGVAALCATACKATVEGENKAWERNRQRVNELAATYPAFGNALREQEKRAEELMAQARSLGDKEQVAKKMAEANALVDSGFVSLLGQLDSRTRALREKLVTTTSQAAQAADQAAARVAAEDAQRILYNVDDAVKAGAQSADAAAAVLRKIDGDLRSASSNLDKVISAAKARDQAAKAGAAPGAAPAGPATALAGVPATGAPAAGAPVAKVQWKCNYCQHLNDDARTKCEHCGAPKPAPKASPAPAKK